MGRQAPAVSAVSAPPTSPYMAQMGRGGLSGVGEVQRRLVAQFALGSGAIVRFYGPQSRALVGARVSTQGPKFRP